MLNKTEIQQWVEDFLKDTDRFVVEVVVKNYDKIFVFLDSDSAITIEHCVQVSKMIESRLDREKSDFELKVSSAGIDHPLLLHRQYIKNIGRKLSIDTKAGKKVVGTLLEVFPDRLVIQEQYETKKSKSKQATTQERLELSFADISRALVQISFN